MISSVILNKLNMKYINLTFFILLSLYTNISSAKCSQYNGQDSNCPAGTQYAGTRCRLSLCHYTIANCVCNCEDTSKPDSPIICQINRKAS